MAWRGPRESCCGRLGASCASACSVAMDFPTSSRGAFVVGWAVWRGGHELGLEARARVSVYIYIRSAAAMAITTEGSMLATRKVLPQMRSTPTQKMRIDPVDAVIVWTVGASVASCIYRKRRSIVLFHIFE